MANDYIHLRSLLFDKPLLIANHKLDDILCVLSDRLHIQSPIDRPTTREPVGLNGIEVDPRLAVVRVHGTLVNRGGIEALSGMTSYESIRSQVERELGGSSDAIVLDVDSMGGEAAGNFDLVDFIRDARAEKPIFSIVNTNALSGGYSIASAAERVFVTSDAMVGSIGIKVLHEDRSELNEKEGRKITELFRGDRKIDMSPHRELSSEAQTFLNRMLDVGYEEFVAVIAKNRGISTERVIETQAAIFLGGDAFEFGLIDEVMPAQQALAEIKTILSTRRNTMSEQTAVAELDDIKAKAAANEAATIEAQKIKDAEDLKASHSAEVAKATSDARAVAAEITKACTLMGSPDMAEKLIADGLTVPEAKARLFDAMAEGQVKIDNSVSDALDAGDDNEGEAMLVAAMKAVK